MISSANLVLYGVSVGSRLMLGTSQYPSPAILAEAARASGAEILTVSLRRESARLKEGQDFWRLIRGIGAREAGYGGNQEGAAGHLRSCNWR